MSDSLRDQLLQAGFAESRKQGGKPGAKPSGKPGKRGRGTGDRSAGNKRHQAAGKSAERQPHQSGRQTASRDRHADASNTEDVNARKRLKAEIKALIDNHRISDHAGDNVYRFILGTRVRELHVTETVRQQLTAGSLVITRLNGKTEIVPLATAEHIRTLNPDWALVTPAQPTEDPGDDYREFTVPDDLQW